MWLFYLEGLKLLFLIIVHEYQLNVIIVSWFLNAHLRDGVYGELLTVCAAYSSHDMTITFGSSLIIKVLCSMWICIILTPLILTFTELCFSIRSRTCIERLYLKQWCQCVMGNAMRYRKTLNSLSPRALLTRNQRRNFP